MNNHYNNIYHHSDLGYTKNLFILAFDHQSSFEKAGFSAKGGPASGREDIPALKQIIYEAFKKSLDTVSDGAILIDEQYGDAILKDAKLNGFTTLLRIEKSGQDEFIFEYGEDFASHITEYQPTFAKARVKIRKEAYESKSNLKKLSDYCHANGPKFLLEVLADGQLDLILKTMSELQDFGVEVDVWKIEGMQNESSYEKIVNQARINGRENVSIVILGRGENRSLVEKWIKIGSKISGVIGFAIGRTIFWEPLLEFNSGRINREQVIEEISRNYIHFYNLFKNQ